MISAVCQHERRRKNGTTKTGATRYRCKDCGKSWTEKTATLGGMRIDLDTAAMVVEMLCEGVSVRATSRMTKVSVPTILDLLVYVGERCEAYMAENIRDQFVGDVQVDEIWQYVFCKKATAKQQNYVGGCGDSYCFTALDRSTKLLVTWHMGRRTEEHCRQFVTKLDRATNGHFHISSDGFKSYPSTIRNILGHRVDHGVLVKIYGSTIDMNTRRYSPARILGASKTAVHGDLYQQEQICTSHVERMNGSIRTFCKRMARLTYCFSKKWTNHKRALGLFFAHYNYCRKHRSLKGQTPAMAHGLATEVWTARDLLERICEGV